MLLTPETRLDSERGNLSLSGERGINTNVTVDGVDYNNAFFGGTVGGAEGRAPLSISQESIKEFSVVTNGASVEFGRSGGGFVNVITKSGTNNLHGSLFYYNQPQSLISDFRPSDTEPRAADQEKEQYGGSLGGSHRQGQAVLLPVLRQPGPGASRCRSTAPDLDADSLRPVSGRSPRRRAYVQTRDGSVAFGRLDYQAPPAHRFMMRGNFTDYEGINGTSDAPDPHRELQRHRGSRLRRPTSAPGPASSAPTC